MICRKKIKCFRSKLVAMLSGGNHRRCIHGGIGFTGNERNKSRGPDLVHGSGSAVRCPELHHQAQTRPEATAENRDSLR